jgi:glycosyltransferase involved in cell wall biosynthesis
MKIHLIGLPHTITSPKWQTCAYTQKVWKLSKMLPKEGFEVIHYGTEGAEVGCKHITVLSRKHWDIDYGNVKPEDFYNIDETDASRLFNINAIREIRANSTPQDIILYPFGQIDISRGLTDYPLQVESGVGYPGTFAPYVVFESNAWMNFIYGKQGIENGRWFDTVIPNYFDPRAFYVADKREDYFLYLGRLIYRKGINIAADICKQLGKKLVIAGQGKLEDVELSNWKNIEFLGPINDPKQRAKLLAEAQAVFSPTIYLEPFGGVTIEAAMSGTPVIVSNFGVYPETIIHGVTGWRCAVRDDFVWAAQHLENFEPKVIRKYAIANFSMDHCGMMYREYFNRLSSLLEKEGWNKEYPEKTNMNWLKKEYPNASDTNRHQAKATLHASS